MGIVNTGSATAYIWLRGNGAVRYSTALRLRGHSLLCSATGRFWAMIPACRMTPAGRLLAIATLTPASNPIRQPSAKQTHIPHKWTAIVLVLPELIETHFRKSGSAKRVISWEL
jgi:hypothetical protein